MSDVKRISKSKAEEFEVVDKGGKKVVDNTKDALLGVLGIAASGIAFATALGIAVKYPQVAPLIPLAATMIVAKMAGKEEPPSEQEKAQREEQAKARREYWAAKIKEERENAAKSPQNNTESKPVEEKPKPKSGKTKQDGDEMDQFLEDYDGGVVLTLGGIPIGHLFGGRD